MGWLDGSGATMSAQARGTSEGPNPLGLRKAFRVIIPVICGPLCQQTDNTSTGKRNPANVHGAQSVGWENVISKALTPRAPGFSGTPIDFRRKHREVTSRGENFDVATGDLPVYGSGAAFMYSFMCRIANSFCASLNAVMATPLQVWSSNKCARDTVTQGT